MTKAKKKVVEQPTQQITVKTDLFVWGVMGANFYAPAGIIPGILQTGVNTVGALSYSGDPNSKDRAMAVAKKFGITRLYPSGEEMVQRLDHLLDGVAIITPNDTHLPLLKATLKSVGSLRPFMILLEKRAAPTLAEVLEMQEILKVCPNISFTQPHQYPMFPCLWALIETAKSGRYGKIRYIKAKYSQDWLATALENDPKQAQAKWRTDPKRAGGGARGDIRSHLDEIILRICGMPVSVRAWEHTHVKGRKNDDHCGARYTFADDSFADLEAVQVRHGALNDIEIEVVTEKATLFWRMREAEVFTIYSKGREIRYHKGTSAFANSFPEATTLTDFAPGHIEGQRDAIAQLIRRLNGDHMEKLQYSRPAWSPVSPKCPNLDEALNVARLQQATMIAAKTGAYVSLDRIDARA